jgi:hypothetical protein
MPTSDIRLRTNSNGDREYYLKSTGASLFTITATGLTLAAGEIIAADIAAASLTGVVAAVVANANVIGGLPVLHRIDVADGSADTDTVLTHKTRVLDVWAVKTATAGGAGDIVTAKNGATAISSAIDLNVADTLIARTTLIDDAQAEIAAAGTLKLTAVKATNCACTVYVLGVRVA